MKKVLNKLEISRGEVIIKLPFQVLSSDNIVKFRKIIDEQKKNRTRNDS